MPANPLPADVQSAIEEEVEAHFKTWQVATGQACKRTTTTTVQTTADGTTTWTSALRGKAAMTFAGRADITATVDGKVVADTRADRVKAQHAFVDSIAPKLSKSPVLNAMLDSYRAALAEPENELVHLYEIVEAANRQHGRDQKAWKALGMDEDDWRFLREAANGMPLRQGRHRGEKMPNLRDATQEELERARAVARNIIQAFAVLVL